MKKPLALVLFVCAALAVTPIALAQTGGNPTPTAAVSCTPLKSIYSNQNWRDAHPLRGENPCSSPNAAELRDHFRLYREYRKLTPYRCQRGAYGTWAIPCYVIACESGFSWTAANPSGAVGPYQLLGWGAPYPARTFRQQVENHRIAHSLSLSNWACA